MSVDGLWTSEIYGLHGWENTGVLVLKGGQAMGGGRNHYSVGNYTLSGNDISVLFDIIYHGTPRTLFGSSDATLSVQLGGRYNDELIEGSIFRQDNPKQTLSVRLTKRAPIA